VPLSCSAGLEHFYPLLPPGRALRRQGHAVAVLTSARLSEAVVAEVFELLPASPGIEALVATAQNRRLELAGIAATNAGSDSDRCRPTRRDDAAGDAGGRRVAA
jgi:hypothetical protein